MLQLDLQFVRSCRHHCKRLNRSSPRDNLAGSSNNGQKPGGPGGGRRSDSSSDTSHELVGDDWVSIRPSCVLSKMKRVSSVSLVNSPRIGNSWTNPALNVLGGKTFVKITHDIQGEVVVN